MCILKAYFFIKHHPDVTSLIKLPFSQDPLRKKTKTEEQTPLLMTIGLFPKRPLVVTLKRKLMLHQEIKQKCPQIQTLCLKIAVRVNFQDLPVTQV